MRYKEARIKKKHEMRGQTKAQVENRSRETAATGITNMCSIEARVSQICAYARDRVKDGFTDGHGEVCAWSISNLRHCCYNEKH